MACGAALLQAVRGDLSHNAHENVAIDMGPKFLGHIEEGVDSQLECPFGGSLAQGVVHWKYGERQRYRDVPPLYGACVHSC